jgi:signal transduction histidine kinase
MNNPFKGISKKTKSRNQIIVVFYRFITIAIAAVLTLITLPENYFKINPFILFGVAVFEGLALSLIPFFFSHRIGKAAVLSLLGADILICNLLIVFSESTNSPFVLYSLSPVLTAALILDKKSTAILAVILGVLVLLSHVFNPFYTLTINPLTVSTLTIYIVAIGLVAILPFLINVNLKQRLEEDQARQERLKLSREIHDGVAQTLVALSWEFQQVRRRLDQNNTNSDDIQKLEKMAEQATRDIRESIEILRSYESKGSLANLLKDSLLKFKTDSNIDFTLNIVAEDVKLDSKTESETLRVFQEALMNIKKHARADKVKVNLKKTNGNAQIDIIDNGQGFDSRSYLSNGAKGHYGLTVMQERVHSINGQFRITSAPGKGTEVNIEVPYSTKED